MDARQALHELEAEHRLDADASRRLASLAGLGVEPLTLRRLLPLGMGALAAALIGLGLVFWIAANWDTLGRFGRFALLQGVVVAMGAAAFLRESWRAPLALLAFIATGALFAYFGQTYQTGADPWQLFALWAALTLPLALGARSDLVWAPWVLVSFVAITAWVHAHSGQRWFDASVDVTVHLAAWCAAGVVIAGMSPELRRFTAAGAWSRRTAVTLAVVLVTSTAMAGLFFSRQIAMTYPLGLVVLGLLAVAFVPARRFDVYALSAVALGLVTLATAGFGRLLFDRGGGGDPIGRLFLLGAGAAALLAGAVSVVLRLARANTSLGDRGEPA